MVKTLTIAIPTYERAAFLVETLESIVAQMSSRVDVIVSDNGSKDQTLEVIAKYTQRYPKVRQCGFTSNQGIDRNIVNCIEQATGDYVFLFSDDDLLMEGSLQAILETIDEYLPSVMCLNHFCFKNHCIRDRFTSFLPCEKKIFFDRESFFKFCGLGFLSSLIVSRSKALEQIAFVKYGKECAHLDIAARVALKHRDPSVFLGTTCVAGRSLISPRYHALDSCIFFPKSFYEDLAHEGLISQETLHFFICRLVYKDLPRVLAKMFLFSEVHPRKYRGALDQAFEGYWIYKRLYRLILSIDRKMMNPFLRGLQRALTLYRKIKFKISRIQGFEE